MLLLPARDLAAQEFASFQVDLKSRFVKHIEATPDYLWVATARGVVRYDRKSKKSVVFGKKQGLPDEYITSLVVMEDQKRVWVGTPSGLALLNTDTGSSTVYNKRTSKITDDRVNTLAVLGNQLFIGTAFGVDVFQFENNLWRSYTAIEGLAGANIQTIQTDGVLVWAGGADGISYYDPAEDLWDSYGVEQGLNSSLVTSMVIDTDAIWVGTTGGGVSRFDRSALRFEPSTSDEGLIDDNVQAIMDDGNYLWIGTFGGLSRMNKNTLVFRNYGGASGLTESSITSGAVLGNNLVVGTDGAGIFEINKEIPQIQFLSAPTRYKKPGELKIYARVMSDEKISDLQVFLRQVESADEYDYTPVPRSKSQESELKVLSSQKSELLHIATLNTSKLKDGRYLITIRGKDSKGNENESRGIVIVDNAKPKLRLFFREPDKGARSVPVSGTYQELNLKSLKVMIGTRPVIPVINRQTRRFRFDYPVDSNQKISVEAQDIALNSTKILEDFIIDKTPPVLKVNPVNVASIKGNIAEITGTVSDENLERVLVMPDNVNATLKPVGNNTYEFSAKAQIKKEGIYTYQIVATDKSGKTTVVPLDVNFVSTVTIVEVLENKLPPFTLKNKVFISGNILGPPLVEFYAIQKSTGERIDISIGKDKSFNVPVSLMPGENTIILYSVYEDGERRQVEYKIKSSNEKVGARFDSDMTSFTTEEVELLGEYDMGVSAVFVNNKKVELNQENRSFTARLKLKKGKNRVKLSWLDELGRVSKSYETIMLDQVKPNVYIRRPPEKTGLQTIHITGKITDDSAFDLVVYPNIELTKIDPETGEFDGVITLEEGINKITFIVRDIAGNTTEKFYIVEFDENFPKVEVSQAAYADELEYLRNELARLREQLKERPKARPTGDLSLVRARLPKTPGLYWAPMAGKVKSYSLTARVYLGSEEFGSLLADYNGQPARSMRRVLVPNPNFFSLISSSPYRSSYEKVIRYCGVAMNRNLSASGVRKAVLSRLLRTRLLKEVKEIRGGSIFILKNGAAVMIVSGKRKVASNVRTLSGAREVLVLAISKKGVIIRKY